jgi:hypothetical protein
MGCMFTLQNYDKIPAIDYKIGTYARTGVWEAKKYPSDGFESSDG